MKIKTTKKTLWSLNTLLVLGMVAFVVVGFALAPRQTELNGQKICGIGANTAARPDLKATGPGPFATYKYIYELPIAGFPPQPVVAPTETNEVTNVPPLAQNYTLEWVKTDPDPFKSYAQVHLNTAADKTIYVSVGRRLGAGSAGVWKLTGVHVEGSIGFATFVRVDTGEEVSLKQEAKNAAPLTGPDSGTGAGTGNGLIDPATASVPSYDDGPSREAVALPGQPDHLVVPHEERRWLGEHWEKLANDIALEDVKDPETKKPIGILFKSIPDKKKQTFLETHGLKPGDVLVSINGVPMKTTQEATAWVKGPGKGLPRYVAVVQRGGRDITLTYDVKK